MKIARVARAAGTAVLMSAVGSLVTAPPAKAWTFAISGDSRNCGDVVMPAIAKAAKALGPKFYWHLGDFRRLRGVDEDLAHDSSRGPRAITMEQYDREAWPDFIARQLRPFEPVRVFLTIGNHEVYGKTREQYLATFRPWLGQAGEASPRTYYRWREQGVEFIAMDNASKEQFEAPQLAWFEKTLAAAVASPEVKAIVVGMHAALPDSISFDHSMSGKSPEAVESGRKVYAALLAARDKGHKRVYVLASHSHYFMDGAYNTPYWRAHGGVLPGWIVGTAGAFRYQLPPEAKNAKRALTKVYGFLVGTVADRTGRIHFNFEQVGRAAVPKDVAARYGKELVDFCFDANAYDQPASAGRQN